MARQCISFARHYCYETSITPIRRRRKVSSILQAGSRKKKYFPRRMSTPFFRFRPCNFAHVPLLTPDVFFFPPDFSSIKIFREKWTTLAQLFSAKKETKKIYTHVRPRDGHVEHVCKIAGSISHKRRGHLDFCA